MSTAYDGSKFLEMTERMVGLVKAAIETRDPCGGYLCVMRNDLMYRIPWLLAATKGLLPKDLGHHYDVARERADRMFAASSSIKSSSEIQAISGGGRLGAIRAGNLILSFYGMSEHGMPNEQANEAVILLVA